MQDLISGIYYGSAHGLYRPTKELPFLSHLVTNYYALGILNVALKNCQQKPLSLKTRLVISGTMTLATLGICTIADNERVTTFMLHIPCVIASFSALYAGGPFGTYTLLTIHCNSLLEFFPEQTKLKVCRIALVHLSILTCGSILEKTVVIGRYILFPVAGPKKGKTIIMGNLLEAGQAVWELRPFAKSI